MNKYLGTLEEFQGEDYSLVENSDEIDSLNNEYATTFQGFLIEFYNGDYACRILGIEGLGFHLSDKVYLVAELD